LAKPKKLSVNLVTDFEPDDNGNAECMKYLHGEELIYCSAYGWMQYSGTHWERTSDAAAYLFAIDTLKRRMQSANNQGAPDVQKKCIQDERRIAQCVKLYQRLSDVGKPDIFDRDPDLLNCLNGVVNLRTGSIEKHKPCQYFTYCLPVDYKPDADMSVWNDFVHDSVRDEEMAHFIQKLVGYSFTGHTNEEKLVYLYGPSRAGKGTFTETLLHLLGEPFATGADFTTFTADRTGDTQNFDLAPLKPARFIVASESNVYQKLNSAKVKGVTGGDPIRCAFKHGTHFTYKPQFTIWLVSNHQVNGDPGDDALWTRLLVIEFPHSHVGEEDTHLKQRLLQPENLEGVLRWAVEGAMRWYAEGLGTPPREITRVTKKQRDDQDYVKQWLNDDPFIKDKKGEVEKYLFETDDWESSADLMKSFKQWCIDFNVKPVDPNRFSIALKRLGYTFERTGKTRTRGYRKSGHRTPTDGIYQQVALSAPMSDLPENGGHLRPPSTEIPQQNGHKTEQNGHISSAKDVFDMVYAMGEGYWLAIGEDGKLKLGVPPEVSDEQFSVLADKIAPYTIEILELIRKESEV
jgi:putative DNA primase/helicase